MTRKELTVVIAFGTALLVSLAAPVEAGTCKSVKAKGVAAKLATASAYARADLLQTAKSMGGKVTQSSTNCGAVSAGYKCKIDAVVCPK
ncbi:MAG TPA: hypothetical protein VLB11_10420 [Methyloceanibacter sp.]|nr:hypothetical protein [Methyloceanibacter sp.]